MNISTNLLAALTSILLLATGSVSAMESDLARSWGGARPVAHESDRARGLVDHGLEYLGVRYRFGGTSAETGLDCSGLVQTVFRNAVGLDLPRKASDMARLGEKIARTELQPGDLVFFDTMRRAFSHVGLYMGGGRFLHAPASGGVVRVEDMNGRYWASRFNGARRLLADSSR